MRRQYWGFEKTYISVRNPQTRRRDVDFVPQISIIYIGAMFDPEDRILSLREKRETRCSMQKMIRESRKNFFYL